MERIGAVARLVAGGEGLSRVHIDLPMAENLARLAAATSGSVGDYRSVVTAWGVAEA